jgi:hypothetical protein
MDDTRFDVGEEGGRRLAARQGAHFRQALEECGKCA